MENARISHYEVGRLLGRGGMGEVYEALDLDLDRRVALKFVAPELAADTEALKRFEREARAAAALNHPHIATLFAFEREGGRTFIAMELVGGESLRARIQRGRLAVAEALAIARDVAGALALAHRRGIVHRDVKPENLMFDEDGVVKLMDFGLARAVQASRMTMTGSTLGTAAYMPPESVRGSVGAPGDVFALGVMLHEMLTGELPFTGESPLALLYTIANEEPKALRAARPEAPEAVEVLVQRMLLKDPGQRPEAGAVARDLAALTGAPPPIGTGDTLELEVSRVDAAGPGDGVLVKANGGEWIATPGAHRGVRPGAAIVVFILLAAAVGGGLLFLRQREAVGHREAVSLNNQGMTLINRQQYDSAAVLFRAALARDAGYGQGMMNLGTALHQQGHAAQAESLFLVVLRTQRGDPRLLAQAYYNLGGLDIDTGAWQSAVENLRKSFALDSTSALAYNNFGFALVKDGRAGDAADLLDRALRRFPTEAMLYKNAGLAAFTLGNDPQARTHLDRALDLDPGNVSARGLRACVRARLTDRAGAVADWQSYLAMKPDDAERVELEREMRARGALR
jgi:tetratricopeptide (TPR) repeat protein/tRNA A-37 threonylcarbamoyl transferase component Bud32